MNNAKEPTAEQLEEARDWRDFKRGGCGRAKERLAERYRPLALRAAAKFCARAGSAVDRDAIESAAFDGLWDAMQGFAPERGFRFATYAPRRIRGAILDECRAADPAGRLQRQRSKRVEKLRERTQQQRGRPVNDDELLALRLVTPADFRGRRPERLPSSLQIIKCSNSDGNRRTEVVETLPDHRQLEPHQAGERDGVLKQVLRGLSLEDQCVLWLYYVRGLTMKEVGEVVGLSESRISQKHARLIAGIAKLRADERAELFRGLGNR